MEYITGHKEHTTTSYKMIDKLPVRNKFVFLSEKIIRKEHIQLTSWHSKQLRLKLERGTYWIQMVQPNGQVHWNKGLLLDLLINGDRPEHQALVSEYRSALAQPA